MRVKKYIVDSMPDALQKIRSDLGKDAVILNTKEIRIGGFLGLFSKKKIEVIAALDTQASETKAKPVLKQEIKAPIIQASAASVLAQISSVAVLEEPLPYVPDVISNHIPPIAPVAMERPLVKEDSVLNEIRQMKEMMSKLASRSQFTGAERHPILAALEEQLIAQEVGPLIVQQILDRVDEELLSSGDELTASNVHHFFHLSNFIKH